MQQNLKQFSVAQLLHLQASTLQELRTRGIIRSANKPTGDIAEYLCHKALGWTLSTNSQLGFDATDTQGLRYQIKARQLIHNTPSERTLSALRNLQNQEFDFLIGILLNPDFSVFKAAHIPYATLIATQPKYVAHDNKHVFHLTNAIWSLPNVTDITTPLNQAFQTL